jgi:hypothetical protein
MFWNIVFSVVYFLKKNDFTVFDEAHTLKGQ